MRRTLTLRDRYYRFRGGWWRLERLLFPSPAEMRFVELLGAKTLTLGWLKSTKTGFPFTLVYRRGRIIKRANLKREVRYGKYYVDFATDLNWIIEVDGTYYHQDVVADMDREIYIKNLLQKNPYGMRLLRIPAPRLWNDRARVQRQVLEFLNA